MKANAKSKELESKSESEGDVDSDWETQSTPILAVPNMSSGGPKGSELRDARGSILIVLLIRCEWCWILDTAGKPSEPLSYDLVCGDV